MAVIFGCTTAVISGWLAIFGIWSYNTFLPNARYEVMTQLAYGVLGKVAWAASLAWVVFACHHGYGGMSIRATHIPLIHLTIDTLILKVDKYKCSFCIIGIML